MTDATQLVLHLGRGDSNIASELFPLVYEELRQLAERCLRGERPDHTLGRTALVHEAYLRLVRSDGLEFRTQAEFMSLAATQIRRILVDHARRRLAEKRGGGRRGTPIDDGLVVTPGSEFDLLALDDALVALTERSPRQSRVVELRFFAGMTVPETARFMGLSAATVKNEWRAARAWLAREMLATGG